MLTSHRHVYEAPSDGAPMLLLLHGTGGNEHDLLGLGRMLYPGAGLLSPRGNVLENGMPRFFRRLEEGVFDLDDLRRRTADLAAFVSAAAVHYGFDAGRVIAVGYSNGANIAAALCLLHPKILHAAVLLHAMVPLVPAVLPDLRARRILITAGQNDPMVAADNSQQLADLLQKCGADVTLHWEAGGHQVVRSEIDLATRWLAGPVPAAAN